MDSFNSVRGEFDGAIDGIRTYHLTVNIDGLCPCILWDEDPRRVSCSTGLIRDKRSFESTLEQWKHKLETALPGWSFAQRQAGRLLTIYSASNTGATVKLVASRSSSGGGNVRVQIESDN